MTTFREKVLECGSTTHDFPLSSYSFIGDADVAWSQLASLKVFKPASSTLSLDLLDVVPSDSQPCGRTTRTFNDTKEFVDYLNHSPIKVGLRFM